MNYNGFFIEKKCGNNEFSYEKRKNKKIYVPPIKQVAYDKDIIIQSLNMSDKVAFSEYDDEIQSEQNIFGIQNFLCAQNEYKKLYIFDNHNHCFYFVANDVIDKTKVLNNTNENILTKYLQNKINKPQLKTMIHFDQHKDMRKPDVSLYEHIKQVSMYKNYFDVSNNEISDTEYISTYTNYVINVGNFIVPLLDSEIIENVLIIDSTYSMEELEKNINNYEDILLDIDLDFFSEKMDYIDNEFKIELIKKCYDKACLITICTSPYFIEFDRAKKYLSKILDTCM